MIRNRCLLDTSIIIDAFRSRNEVSKILDRMEEVYVPVTVLGELFFGAYNSNNFNKHFNAMQSFLKNCIILQTDETTAKMYGRIKASLAKKENPIPENDVWIAAIALQFNLPLYAADIHFSQIDDLQLI